MTRILPLLLLISVLGTHGAERTPDEIKSRAYQFYAQKQLDQALAEFAAYLKDRPGDLQLKLDYAGVLSEAKRHADAARLLEEVWKGQPAHESARFRLAVEYVYLGRTDEAAKIFAELGRSTNEDLAEAASDAANKLKFDIGQQERLQAEQNIFVLADKAEHRQVVAGVDQLERTAPLTFALAMQRLYALHSLQQYASALKLAEPLAKLHPTAPDLGMLRADLLAQLGRRSEAVTVLREVERNKLHAYADQAAKRLRELEDWLAAERVYDLARQAKHREVLIAIEEVEARGPLPWHLELQRLHALVALGRRNEASQRIDRLSRSQPDHPDLITFREFLLRNEPPAPKPPLPPATPPEETIYALANAQRYHETIGAIDALERTNRLSTGIQLQRLYALQAVGDWPRAHEEARKAHEQLPGLPEVALIRADLLIQDKRWADASLILGQLVRESANTNAIKEATRRLDAMPAIANLNKWYWGEAYNSGDYLGRFGTLVGSGFARHGYFVPRARWLQPYAELRYTVDTRSGGAQRTTVADNYLGGYLGARIQPFVEHYFFLYAQIGMNKDFLERREDGDWAYDSQAGAYGFKSWGPGTVLLSLALDETVRTSGGALNPGADKSTRTETDAKGYFWRGDWFVDAGADFSYYHRHSSWIGYGQAHEGFRLLQLGATAALDAYLVENISWDVRGNYFDNLIEVGPGARLLWVPRQRWEIVLRTEWLNGFYWGRNDLNNRGNAGSHYDDFRVGLSIGTRW